MAVLIRFPPGGFFGAPEPGREPPRFDGLVGIILRRCIIKSKDFLLKRNSFLLHFNKVFATSLGNYRGRIASEWLKFGCDGWELLFKGVQLMNLTHAVRFTSVDFYNYLFHGFKFYVVRKCAAPVKRRRGVILQEAAILKFSQTHATCILPVSIRSHLCCIGKCLVCSGKLRNLFPLKFR